MRPQLFERHGKVSHHRRAHPLTHLLVGNSGDRDVAHGRMGAQRFLDLDRSELLSPAVDGVAEPAAGVDVSVDIPPCEVAGMQPAFGDVLDGVHPQLADNSGLDVGPRVRIDHADLNPGQRLPDRAHPVGIAVILRQQGGVGAERFGLAKHVGKRDMRQGGHCPAH